MRVGGGGMGDASSRQHRSSQPKVRVIWACLPKGRGGRGWRSCLHSGKPRGPGGRGGLTGEGQLGPIPDTLQTGQSHFLPHQQTSMLKHATDNELAAAWLGNQAIAGDGVVSVVLLPKTCRGGLGWRQSFWAT